jgi:hypothetical protein
LPQLALPTDASPSHAIKPLCRKPRGFLSAPQGPGLQLSSINFLGPKLHGGSEFLDEKIVKAGP